MIQKITGSLALFAAAIVAVPLVIFSVFATLLILFAGSLVPSANKANRSRTIALPAVADAHAA